MSARELEALKRDSTGSILSRLRSCTRGQVLSQHNPDINCTSTSIIEELGHADTDSGETEQLPYTMDPESDEPVEAKLQEAKIQLQVQTAKILELERLLELTKMQSEVDKYKALEAQRKGFEGHLAEARESVREEKKRCDSWIQGLTESSARERQQYEARLSELSLELEETQWRPQHREKSPVSEPSNCPSSIDSEVSDEHAEVSFNESSFVAPRDSILPSAGGCPTISDRPSSTIPVGANCSSISIAFSKVPCASVAYTTPIMSESLPSQSVVCPIPIPCEDNLVTSTTRNPLSSSNNTVTRIEPSIPILGPDTHCNLTSYSNGNIPSLCVPKVAVSRAPVLPKPVPMPPLCTNLGPNLNPNVPGDPLFENMNKLLQAQTEMLAAQARAVAVQNLPPLTKFSGSNPERDDETFERWFESFEDRASLAGWTQEYKLYQLKTHLQGTASQVVRMMAKEEQKVYSAVVSKLRIRFRPIDIEELKSIEFYQKMQGSESVENLGVCLQQLAMKAFPNTTGPEFDRLLRGRFFQALHTKWQRKLGAPKSGESFSDLYDRARTLESHDKQFSAASNKPSERTPQRRSQSTTTEPSSGNGRDTIPKGSQVSDPRSPHNSSKKKVLFCFNCDRAGHHTRDCRSQSNKGVESKGRSTSAALTAILALNQFTDQQLEGCLAFRRRTQETELMTAAAADSEVRNLNADSLSSPAVGPTPQMRVDIEGVQVTALVDSGSQSTVISRPLLHQISRKLKSQGMPLPELLTPSVKLFGKDGRSKDQPLNITAEAVLKVSADGRTVKVPVFIQPDSEQPCLLGTNLLPALGIKLLRLNGEPLIERSSDCGTTSLSVVRLLQTETIPGRRGRFLSAQFATIFPEGKEFVFQPNNSTLASLGVYSTDALVTPSSTGLIQVPFHNHKQEKVSLEKDIDIGTVEILEYPPCGEQTCLPEAGVLTVSQSQPLPDSSDKRKLDLKNSLVLPTDDLTPEQVQRLKDTILGAHDVFSLNDDDLGHTSLVQHQIVTGDNVPIKQPPRRIPFSQRDKVSSLIDEMIQKGVVQPSTSAWASPIVLVSKRDGSKRFCVDYRKLNAITKRDVYPLPRIDDILDTLGKSRFFSTLDLTSGFWQIGMDPSTREKSAFVTHKGLHEFVRMPFGLCNAPATFQRLMQVVLAGLEWKNCFVYMDDILVCSETFDEHLGHLELVFERLRKANLTLRPDKCYFVRREVKYLGHVISRYGISPDPDKTSKVKDFPLPKDVRGLRQFLGLASYYRRFVPKFAAVAGSLHKLLKNDTPFEWTRDCQESFDKLKLLLTTAPVLAYPRFGCGQQFVLETDASLLGLGAVLSQKQEDGLIHPIAYASRSLQSHERNYCITELETLGLVWATKHFRAYMLGHHTTVYTDHSACTSLFNCPKPSAKLARWAMCIQEFDITIKHRSGKSNANADALSRNPLPEGESSNKRSEDNVASQANILSLSTRILDCENKDLIVSQRKDEDLNELIQYLESGLLPPEESKAKRIVLEATQFDLIGGILHHQNPKQQDSWRVVVPSSSRQVLLNELHGGRFSGHFAWRRIYNTLKKRYWWKGMCGDTETFCKSCVECVTRKGSGRTVRPPLVPIPVGGPFHRVGVDVLQLPLTESGNRYVVVFVDYLTKWVEAFAVHDQTARTIAHLLVNEIFCRHGAPEHLLSDRGPNFLSELVAEVCSLLKIKKVNTSGYHPQTDGLVEKMNSTIIEMLSKVAETSGRDWDVHLPFLLFAHRVSVHDSTKESPFYLLYGRDARLPSEHALSALPSPYKVDVDDYREELVDCLSTAWRLAKDCIKGAQDRQKKSYDKNAKEHCYRVGDRVMIHMPSAVTGKAWKLARPYHGPYRVLAVTPTNIEVKLVDDPDTDSIFVAIGRARPCYHGVPNTPWTGKKRTRSRPRKQDPPNNTFDGPMTRSRSKN